MCPIFAGLVTYQFDGDKGALVLPETRQTLLSLCCISTVFAYQLHQQSKIIPRQKCELLSAIESHFECDTLLVQQSCYEKGLSLFHKNNQSNHIACIMMCWWVDYKKLITYCSYTLKRSQFNSFNACDIIIFPPASASPQLWVIKMLSHLYQNLTIPKQLRSLYFCILMSFLGWILYILSDDG